MRITWTLVLVNLLARLAWSLSEGWDKVGS